DYQRAAGNPFADKQQLAATYGDPTQIAQRIKQTEEQVTALRQQQAAKADQAPSRTALPKRTAGETSPAQQPTAKGSAAAATAQQPPVQIGPNDKAKYDALPSGTIVDLGDGRVGPKP